MTINNKLKRAFFYVLPGLIVAIAWQTLSVVAPNGTFRFGSVTSVLRAAAEQAHDLGFYADIGLTVSETVLGLCAGTALGTAVGMLFWLSTAVGRVMRPYVIFAGAVPIVALSPIMIQTIGIGFIPRVIFVSISVFLLALSQSYEGASNVVGEPMDIMRAVGATKFVILRKLILPNSVAHIASGIRLNIGFALIGAFIAEYINSEHGLGRFIIQESGLYNTSGVLLGVIVLGLVGIGLNHCFATLLRKYAPTLAEMRTPKTEGTR